MVSLMSSGSTPRRYVVRIPGRFRKLDHKKFSPAIRLLVLIGGMTLSWAVLAGIGLGVARIL